ncbi:hypothetical protein LTR67_011095 [Exophiala xenobiotica]
MVYDHPDLQQIQAMGLLAFFLTPEQLYISVSQTSFPIDGITYNARAWTLLGSAIRHAVSLGLHLKVTDASMGPSEQSERAKIWYSLYTLEVLLAEITGRPKSITVTDATIPVDLITLQGTRAPGPSSRLEDPLYSYSRSLWLESIGNGRYLSHESSENVVGPQYPRDEGEHPHPEYIYYRLLLTGISDRIAVEL